MIKLSDIVQAYQARETARHEYTLALTADDRTEVVGEDLARAARAAVVRTGRELTVTERKLEDLLWLAREEALTREGDDA